MAVGRDGYVGALQLQDGLLDVAAAFQPAALKRSSPGELAQQTMDQSGLPATKGLDQLRWLGTPPLSKRATSPAAERLFLVGDSAGYVEPFTGEGMSWAMSSGRAVVPFVLKTILDSTADDAINAPALWTQEQRRLLNHRKRACHWLTRALRHPPLVSAGVFTLARMPILASPVVQWMNRTPQPSEC
jgi:2-polyprenyl-6-methoxyphenol hydroxylase-like FAD-dependent oxidoreductase